VKVSDDGDRDDAGTGPWSESLRGAVIWTMLLNRAETKTVGPPDGLSSPALPRRSAHKKSSDCRRSEHRADGPVF
jgi:hypothetical protein